MDNNRVWFGLSNVHVAFIDPLSVDSGALEYGAPIPVPGAVDWSPDPETKDFKLYADNGIYYASFSDNGYKGDLEVAKIPDDVLVEMLGWEIDALTGGLIEYADGKKKNFALLAQIEGDETSRRIVYYYCAGGKPSQKAHTAEEDSEVQTQKMDVTVMPIKLEVDGVQRKIVKFALSRDEKNPETVSAYDNFFKEVYIPGLEEEE